MKNSTKDKKILTIITNETRDTITQMDVVTPSIYASLFSKIAHEHNQNLDNELEISHDIVQEECSSLRELQTKASENANKLSSNTDKAIHAIKEKDESLLQDILKETEALRKEIEKLKASVYRDELTHAYNRKWFHDTYIDEASRSFKKAGILAMLDLNYFKQINDTHGHIIGDKVLIFFANELRKTRHHVIRYGGDEFIIIFSDDYSLADAKKSLHHIREDVIDKKLKAHNATFKVSFSFGLTHFKAHDELTNVIEDADKIMYKDKIEIKKRVTGI
jgi:diguanylate cyclase (GGDEF)-like protein